MPGYRYLKRIFPNFCFLQPPLTCGNGRCASETLPPQQPLASRWLVPPPCTSRSACQPFELLTALRGRVLAGWLINRKSIALKGHASAIVPGIRQTHATVKVTSVPVAKERYRKPGREASGPPGPAAGTAPWQARSSQWQADTSSRSRSRLAADACHTQAPQRFQKFQE